MAMTNTKRHHPTVGILYRIRTAPGEKDLGFIKIEGTPDETIVVWTNTLLKIVRPGARVIVGVEDVYEQELKRIIIQIFCSKRPEMEERIGKVSILHFVCLFVCLFVCFSLSLSSIYANCCCATTTTVVLVTHICCTFKDI